MTTAESASPPELPDDAALAAAIATTILAVPGVSRLYQPRISPLGVLAAGNTPRHAGTSPEVVLQTSGGGRLSVTADIEVSAPHRAPDVCRRVYRSVRKLLQTDAPHPCTIHLTVVHVSDERSAATS